MPECSGITTWIVHAVRRKSSQELHASPQPLCPCPSKSRFGMISTRPHQYPTLSRSLLSGRHTGSCYILLDLSML